MRKQFNRDLMRSLLNLYLHITKLANKKNTDQQALSANNLQSIKYVDLISLPFNISPQRNGFYYFRGILVSTPSFILTGETHKAVSKAVYINYPFGMLMLNHDIIKGYRRVIQLKESLL